MGTIQPRKNLIRLIEAYSKLIENWKLKIENLPALVLAGSPGWLYKEIYAAPRQFGVENLVKFMGRVPDGDLPALLTGCRAFVFPSLYEGFGLSLLEALGCGAVTVTSKVTGLPEFGGEASIFVEPTDGFQLKAAMEKVIKLTDRERDDYSQRALLQAKKFSWQESAQQTLSLIDSM